MIPVPFYLHSCPPFESAYRRADAIIDSWLEGLKRCPALYQNALDAISGWDGVTLREGIISAILEADGWDTDAFDDVCNTTWDHPETVRLLNEWVQRGPTMIREVV